MTIITPAHPEPSLEDIFVWPDDTWCYREDGDTMTYMSDDYEVLFYGTSTWHSFMLAQDS